MPEESSIHRLSAWDVEEFINKFRTEPAFLCCLLTEFPDSDARGRMLFSVKPEDRMIGHVVYHYFYLRLQLPGATWPEVQATIPFLVQEFQFLDDNNEDAWERLDNVIIQRFGLTRLQEESDRAVMDRTW